MLKVGEMMALPLARIPTAVVLLIKYKKILIYKVKNDKQIGNFFSLNIVI
jgi:hypothetical protein